ncbi:MAG: hypothetical protein K5639_01110 [Eubacterium sp.]|nr:hypothetical protein [Eubacterium sp.]
MKKFSKLAIVLAVAVVACFALVGCGEIKIDDIKGDWTVDTINGQSLADYAASIGITEGQAVTNITINDDKTMTSTNAVTSEEFDIELKGNGFEVKQKGQSAVFMSVTYDKDKQTLSYKIKDASGNEVEYVMKKGKGNIEPIGQQAAEGGDAEQTTDDASAEESTEESTDDGAAADEGGEDAESAEQATE